MKIINFLPKHSIDNVACCPKGFLRNTSCLCVSGIKLCVDNFIVKCGVNDFFLFGITHWLLFEVV